MLKYDPAYQWMIRNALQRYGFHSSCGAVTLLAETALAERLQLVFICEINPTHDDYEVLENIFPGYRRLTPWSCDEYESVGNLVYKVFPPSQWHHVLDYGGNDPNWLDCHTDYPRECINPTFSACEKFLTKISEFTQAMGDYRDEGWEDNFWSHMTVCLEHVYKRNS